MSIVRAAVVQDAPPQFDTPATLAKVEQHLREARKQGAQLAVFPEAFIGGYPKGMDFGARVGMRSMEGRADFQRYYDGAIQVPGPVTDALGKMAAEFRLFTVIGVIEQTPGTLYCSVLFFGPDGALIGKRRKVMPTAMERLVWGFGDGSTLGVFPTPVGRIGAVICWENYMPLLRMAMYGQGIQLYCACTLDDRETWQPTMRHIALEGRCFVLSSCQFARRSDFPDWCKPAPPAGKPASSGDEEPVLIRGGSCIVSPLGRVLAGPVYDRPDMLVADLDLAEIAQGKYDLDVAGHYARPDIFQLTVNTQPQKAVSLDG
jgi:nitrilase